MNIQHEKTLNETSQIAIKEVIGYIKAKADNIARYSKVLQDDVTADSTIEFEQRLAKRDKIIERENLYIGVLSKVQDNLVAEIERLSKTE